MSLTLEFAFVLLLFLSACSSEEQFEHCQPDLRTFKYPIIAHSHNDYDQDVPIITALNHGFRSLEVDVAFDGNVLRVSHDTDDLEDQPLFEDDYLLPLLEHLPSDSAGLILLVDIKNYSTELLDEINIILDKQASHLITRNNPELSAQKIKIILSGDIPRAEIINNNGNIYLFIDGRLNDKDLDASSDILPLISLDFSDISGWNGKNEPNKQTISTIKETIDRVHDSGKLIRFWKTPDREAIWLNLIELEIDIIGVDDIEHFCSVMQEHGLVE